MSERPIRIQRRRTKGWEMPPNTVYVGRPTMWGNPFVVGTWAAREGASVCGFDMGEWCVADDIEYASGDFQLIRNQEDAVAWFDWYANHCDHGMNLTVLRGKNLACWCPLDKPCHADVLLEMANR